MFHVAEDSAGKVVKAKVLALTLGQQLACHGRIVVGRDAGVQVVQDLVVQAAREVVPKV